MTRAKDISKIVTDADLSGTLDVTGTVTVGNTLSLKASLSNPITFENQHSVTTDASISTYDDANGTLISLGSNFYFNNGSEQRFNTGEESSAVVLNRTGTVQLKTGSTGAIAVDRLKVDSAGDISFYEDTGTTPKLFWDADEEVLNLNTTSTINNNFRLNIKGNGGNGGIVHSPNTDAATVPVLRMLNAAVSANVAELGTASGSDFYVSTGGTERMRIDSSGDFLFLGGTIRIKDSGNTAQRGAIYGSASEFHLNAGVDNMVLTTSGGEAMRIDSSGNVGIGTSLPVRPLNIKTSDTISATLYHNSSSGTTATDGFFVGTSVADAVLWNYENGTMQFATNNLEAMRITSGGDLLVNTTTDTGGGFSIQTISNNTTATRILAHGFSCRNNWGTATNLDNGIFSPAGGALAFSTGSVERMRIDSNGKLLVGSTTNILGRIVSVADLSTMHTCTFQNSANNTGNIFLRQQNYLGQDCGNITQTGSTTVSYGTSSDYRLKENVVYNFDATTRLKKLKPCRFNFIADGADKVVDGFLAHEVANDADGNAIVPEAIVGQKDAVDENGNPILQQIDPSKLVPLLVKTIQELEARIVALETAN